MSVVRGTPASYKPKYYTPADYLSGSKKVGDTYTAWNTYGGPKPDFGVGAGPGIPYHKIQKKVSIPIVHRPAWGLPAVQSQPVQSQPQNHLPQNGGWTNEFNNPKITAIRRRLGWS